MKQNRRLFLACFLLASGAPLFAQPWGSQTDARSFADSVLALRDSGQYGPIYEIFSEKIQKRITQSAWINLVTANVAKEGSLVSRTFTSIQVHKDGYQVTYSAKYAKAGAATNSVYVLQNPANGSWKVMGVWTIIKPSSQ